VWVFSDPPKSVSELVKYVPSTLSSRYDFCSPYDLIWPCFLKQYDTDQEGQVGRRGREGCRGGRFWIFFGFFGNFWLFWQFLAFGFLLVFLANFSFLG
jgi:hypothetical protein